MGDVTLDLLILTQNLSGRKARGEGKKKHRVLSILPQVTAAQLLNQKPRKGAEAGTRGNDDLRTRKIPETNDPATKASLGMEVEAGEEMNPATKVMRTQVAATPLKRRPRMRKMLKAAKTRLGRPKKQKKT